MLPEARKTTAELVALITSKADRIVDPSAITQSWCAGHDGQEERTEVAEMPKNIYLVRSLLT
jgi:hypothetical protein